MKCKSNPVNIGLHMLKISDIQKEAISLVMNGETFKSAAKKMGIDPDTVRYYVISGSMSLLGKYDDVFFILGTRARNVINNEIEFFRIYEKYCFHGAFPSPALVKRMIDDGYLSTKTTLNLGSGTMKEIRRWISKHENTSALIE